MKIVSFKICPFVQRVTALLEAKEIPYDIEFIDLKNKPQWFLDVSPNGQVPILITDNGQTLFESDAIFEYIEEVHPPLQEGLSPEEKATNRAWSYLASKNYLVQCGAQTSADAEILAERAAKLGKAFDKMEQQLGNSTHFNGEDLSIVDISWLPLLHRAEIVERLSESHFDFIGERPKLKQWQKNLLQTGLAEKSVAPDFEEAFTSFYLSEKTFLGQGGNLEECTSKAESEKNSCCG